MDYLNSEMKALICEHVHSSRDRKLMYRKMVDGITFEKLAKEIGLSVRQTKNVYYKYYPILLSHLQEPG